MRRRWRGWVLLLGLLLTPLLLFGAYVAAGVYLVPRLIRHELTAWAQDNLHKTLSVGEIRFDPLKFTADLDDLAIPAGRSPMVAVGRLHIGFSIWSVFRGPYVFESIRIERPFVHAVIRPDRTLNLTELLPKPTGKKGGPGPAIRIGTFAVERGKVVYDDQSLAERPRTVLAPVGFTLRDFQTNLAQGGAFRLKARSERGEAVVWTGGLSVAPLASRGRLEIADLRSDTVQGFFGARLPVVLKSGKLGFHTDYAFAYGKAGLRLDLHGPGLTLAGLALDGKPSLFRGSLGLEQLTAEVGHVALAGDGRAIRTLQADMPRLALHGIALSGPDGPGAARQTVKLADASLTDASLDYVAHTLHLGALTLKGAELPVRRARNGTISLTALLPAAAPKPAAAAGSTSTAQGAPWRLHLDAFALEQAAVHFEDQTVTPTARFAVTPISVSASGIDSDLTQPVKLRFGARVNRTTRIEGDGTVILSRAAGDLKVRIAHLPLGELVAYAPRFPGVELKSGEASLSGRLQFRGGDLAALRFHGDGSVDNLDVYESAVQSSLFSWKAFTLGDLDYRADRIEIGLGRLVGPSARIAVLPDRTLNLVTVMTADASRTAPPVAVSQAPVPKPVVSAAVRVASPTAAKAAFALGIKRLEIQDGTMSFADLSIDPNFQARIDALQGSISDISNAPGQIATIDLGGQVIDRFSPVSIQGTMDLLGYAHSTDIHMVFRNIELPIFNPYSGRYAGYDIAKGKLTTDLTYKIDNGALKADHHVVIDQLEWGKPTDSKQKAPWPVRLATALLKNKDGVIDLNVPVTGSLNDPKFRFGPIIWQIVGNLLDKAVTAPFRLIGSLFAGAEKAQFVDFAPGSAILPTGSSDALKALAKGLEQRPGLNLDIPAGPASAEDATPLENARIDAALAAKTVKPGGTADISILKPGQLHDRLRDLYRSKLGKKPVFPNPLPGAPAAGAGGKGPSKDERLQLESDWMRAQLRPAFAPSKADLADLGHRRATAVRDALLDGGGIDPKRVFMAVAMSAQPADGAVRLELKLR